MRLPCATVPPAGARAAVGTEQGGHKRVRAGDTVWIAPNERHWYGATSNTLMSHTTTTMGATEFHEAVTEAEYAAANASRRGDGAVAET
jgi:hypothetical protein